ncbi:L-histidine N(alpha)-methyltransferase [Sphingobium phenoxybenzoativorans]|uniref:L-histidine N(Alpha)-methyltransferase n=1 Tax=Sphingobium phenoxybenzoativorans TaxID=1592790 RepID=A0A975K5L5_9SPHN|nr:L-histidine N(alpha)-methyltransferase [Sphingobium phenoxybenzoativorans]QUT05228.1 L-histidine N(alpha)-methyltransferase [Sphingobium phenoxybenzoativorans]
MLLELDRDAPQPTADPAFRRDIIEGFSRFPKSTPPIWFYDRRGSELFEEITRLPEYYPTRVETAMLSAHCGEVGAVTGPGRAVVEFGAGSAIKTPHLLSAIAPAAYVPVDISGDFLRESSAVLAAQFPDLPVVPVEADFTKAVALPKGIAAMPKLGFFPGSTIGNMTAAEAVDLLRTMRSSLGEGAMLLIGMDRVKDIGVLVSAYDDAAGVTAAFNLNLLARINRELGGTIPVEAFAHRAIWNDDAARIEMHLEARRDVDFTIDNIRFSMCAGETIHTENSHKYGPRDARLLLRAGGWEPLREWIAPDDMFAMILAKA